MTETLRLQTTQYHLARHYLDRLRAAAAAVQHGRASLAFGIRLFDQEWAHIQHWQALSARRCADDDAWTRLCKEFPLEGAEILSIRQHPAERAQWLNTALAAAEQLGDAKAECAILFQLFMVDFAMSMLDEAEEHVRRLSALARATGDRLYGGRAIYALACIHEERGKYAEARSCYEQGREIFQKLHADLDLSTALHGLGSVALYVGQYEQAQGFFLSHLALAESAGRESDVCRGLLTVAQGYLALEDFPTAEDYARRGVKLSRALGYQGMLTGGLLTLGACAVEQNRLEDALAPLHEGIKVARAIGSQRNLIHGLSSLGYVEFRLNHHTEALAHFHEALALARSAGLPRFVCNVLRQLASTHVVSGDLDAAQHELREGLALAQSLDSDLQRVRTISIAVMLWQRQGHLERAAFYAGLLDGSNDVDHPVYDPVCEALETDLGSERYRQLLEQGKTQTLIHAVSEALLALE